MTAFDGQVAVLTGGGSGFGRRLVQLLGERGASVIALDADAASAARAVAELGDRGASFGVDVTKEDQVVSAIGAATTRFGRLDLLVNNAGVNVRADAPVHQTALSEWERLIAVNATGPFLVAKAVLPQMVAQGHGVLLTIASIAGLSAFHGRVPYSVSKAAAIKLTECIAAEYAPHGIRANVLCPGWMETPMTRTRLADPAMRTMLEDQVPLGRIASIDDVADAALYLLSDAARYVTGTSHVVDGGAALLRHAPSLAVHDEHRQAG
jgi:NAD(P)-dependent dehydrogenase (short-subunit alcohol dehydrogenase family)